MTTDTAKSLVYFNKKTTAPRDCMQCRRLVSDCALNLLAVEGNNNTACCENKLTFWCIDIYYTL